MNWNYEEGRIFGVEDNKVMAEVTYYFTNDNEIVIDHTFVDPSLRGQGVAGKMMEVVAQYLRDNNMKASATCSYANAWLKKHKESYSDIMSFAIDDADVACKLDGKR